MVPSPAGFDRSSGDSAASSTCVEWDYGTVRWLRWLRYAALGILGGIVLVTVGMVVVLLGFSLRGVVTAALAGTLGEETVGLVLLVVLLALVGGPFSLLYLLPMLRDPDQRPTFVPAAARGPRLDRRWLALAVVLGAVVIVGSVLAWPALAGALVVVALAVGLLSSPLSMRHRLDGESLTVSNGVVTRSLDRTRAVRRHDLPSVSLTLFRLVPEGGPSSLDAPRVLFVPTEQADDAAHVLDRAVSEARERERASNPQVRLAAAGLGAFLLVVGVVVGLLAGPVGWYAALLLGLFAVLLLAVAVFEG